ncbi:hypothetical protein NVV94_16740 [Pseudomonas sp. LS1212]|uniref:hypothetical protein n=1 Tax=Pseudomonas sp. LS1212 TaxID=2972478 RepID=UPI00215C7478|nr:hypothetical protein [Pseudomonas sp. LS1212]UVJ42286.1 hypothetical protein NVV94_16740 [Pseudomonas sp. LS1212]
MDSIACSRCRQAALDRAAIAGSRIIERSALRMRMAAVNQAPLKDAANETITSAAISLRIFNAIHFLTSVNILKKQPLVAKLPSNHIFSVYPHKRHS